MSPIKFLFRACMHAVVSVSRTLVHPGPTYPEGPTHVIPMLLAVLPGIDPNDMHKSMVTFQVSNSNNCHISYPS